MLTREWPPDVYGGAGVHVDFLVRELRRLVDVEVHCFGAPREGAVGARRRRPRLPAPTPRCRPLVASTWRSPRAVAGCDVVHSPHLVRQPGRVSSAALLHGVPHVMTAHSLEPQRPWKVEQLGGGYRLSSWAERTAYRNARRGHRGQRRHERDVLAVVPVRRPRAQVHVVYNGIDTGLYHPTRTPTCWTGTASTRTRPYVDLRRPDHPAEGRRAPARAARAFDPEAQLVLCAGAPDTPEIGADTAAAVPDLQASRARRAVDRADAAADRGGAAARPTRRSFVCPSVYEPLGIVNLEAMACETAGRGERRRRHPEVVVDGETGTAGAVRRSELPGRASRPASPWPSMRWSATPLGPARWAGQAAEGRWRTSAGRRSPATRSTCTNPCSPGIDLGLVFLLLRGP